MIVIIQTAAESELFYQNKKFLKWQLCKQAKYLCVRQSINKDTRFLFCGGISKSSNKIYTSIYQYLYK